MPGFTKIPSWLQLYNKDICWQVSDTESNVHLSFDDGPHPVCTPLVLDILAQSNLKATFFCLGEMVINHPDIYARIIAEGHTIGNHSYSHPNGWSTSVTEYVKDVMKAKEQIPSALFRPPYGRLTPMQFKVLKKKFKIIMWDILSKDYDNSLSDQEVIDNVVNNVSKGSIIVMHDNHQTEKRMAKVLPQILEKLQKEGWKFKTL